jgi:hypothetical protein
MIVGQQLHPLPEPTPVQLVRKGRRSLTGLLAILIAAAATISAPCAGQDFNRAQDFSNAEWLKAAATDKENAAAVKGFLRLDRASREVRFISKDKSTELAIRQDAIKSMAYQAVNEKIHFDPTLIVRWYRVLVPSTKHLFTIQYEASAGSVQSVEFCLDKSNYQKALDAVEKQIGKKVEKVKDEH